MWNVFARSTGSFHCPFLVAEIFTGTPGAFVDLETAINDFEEALSGYCDDISEAVFYMVGGKLVYQFYGREKAIQQTVKQMSSSFEGKPRRDTMTQGVRSEPREALTEGGFAPPQRWL